VQLAPWKKLAVVDVQNNPWRCNCDLVWFINELVPLLEDKTPDLVVGLQ
jgi:hypothetical protein